MRQLHTTQKTDELTKKLTDCGLTMANMAWMAEYLAFDGQERPELLEQAQRQEIKDLTQPQCIHCAETLEWLLNQGNMDIRNRTAKAFFAVLGTGLADEQIMQARPWQNLYAKLSTLPLDRLLGPTATLAFQAGSWRGNPAMLTHVKGAQPEALEKALDLCGGPEDPARVILACLWLAQKGPEKNNLLKSLVGKKEDHRWAEDMVREGTIALLPRMSRGLLSGDISLLSDYIRRGGDGPLPKLSGKITSLESGLPSSIGSACFLALEAAPALQSAFLVCAAVQPANVLRASLELAGTLQFRAKVPWLMRHTEFSVVLSYLCSSSHRKLAVDMAKQYPDLFEQLLLRQNPLRQDSPTAKVFQEAYPERFQKLFDQARPKAMSRAIEALTSKIANPAPYKHFLKTGEGLAELIPGHILGHGNFPLYGYNEIVNYGMEYGLDDFMVRCIIVSAMSTTSYGVSACWSQIKISLEERNMGCFMDRMHGMGLGYANCLAITGGIYENTYHDNRKKQIDKESTEWLLRQPAEAVEEAAGGTVYARSTAARARAAGGDFDGLLAMATDTSKQVRMLIADLFAAHPTNEGPKAALKLLESKKAGQRETGLVIIGKLDQSAHLHGLFVQKYRPQLEAALAKEKSSKLAFHLRKILGIQEDGAAVPAGAPEGDPVKLALKGGKKRKVQWVLDGVAQQAGGMKYFDAGQNSWVVDKSGQQPSSPGLLLDEDRLAAVMVSLMDAGGVQQAKSLAKPLDQKALTAYVHAVYDLWIEQNAPSKQKWVLTFAAVFGGREMVETLKRQISQWPLEARGAIACEAVNALALSPEPEALLLVDSISRKFKYKQVKAAAGKALEYAAKELGLTAEELADRIVPDLGLDQRGNRVFDYGARSFTVTLTPALELEVRNQEGKKLKTLPAVGKQDDAAVAEASLAEFKALKKQIKATVSTQTLRLEQALSANRTWTAQGWRELFVQKPVMRQFAVGLLWGVYEEDRLTAAFRYLEDGSFGTVDEEEYELPEEAKVGLVHPVELDGETLEAWKQQLEDYEIRQPFPQLDRGVARPEQGEAKALELFGGKMVNALSLMGKMQAQGWFRGPAEDGGVFMDFYREDGPIGAQLNFSGAYAGGEDSDVEVWDIWFYRKSDIYKGVSRGYVRKENCLSLQEVPPRLYSEIVYQIRKATASSTETKDDWKSRMGRYQ